jgi:nitroreductase
VRQYSDEPVDPADIEFAAAAAQRAPAVCNRQFGRLYVYTERVDIDRILELQGGARGFGDQLRGLAIVTTDLRNFWAAGERHQAWTDGGLFAMSFVLGLHARGLGTVCLNWSKTPRTDQQLREIANLPEESVVIMLVGFGHLRESYSVASSIRVPLSEVLELR